MPNVTLQIIQVVGASKDIDAFINSVRSKEPRPYGEGTVEYGFDAYRIADQAGIEVNFRQMATYNLFGGLNQYLDVSDIQDLTHRHRNSWRLEESDDGLFTRATILINMGYERLPHDILNEAVAKHPNIAMTAHWDSEFNGTFGRGVWLNGKLVYADDFEGPSHVDALVAFQQRET